MVLAVGVPPLQRLVSSSPLLASCEELRGVNELRCSDVLAVRLWLDRPLTFRTPSNVVAGFDPGVGGTLFHLNDLQVGAGCCCCRGCRGESGSCQRIVRHDTEACGTHQGDGIPWQHATECCVQLPGSWLQLPRQDMGIVCIRPGSCHACRMPLTALTAIALLLPHRRMSQDVHCPVSTHVCGVLTVQDQYRDAGGAVLEFDLYHANSLLPCSDEALVDKLLRQYLPVACPEAGVLPPAVQDASVLRAVRAVTQFSPGSAAHLPPISVASCAGLFVAGDCVEQGPGTHGAKGLSQEKAYVTGLQVGGWAQRGAHRSSCMGMTLLRHLAVGVSMRFAC